MADIADLVFFGDSLTDQGVLSALTSRTAIVTIPVPSAGYGTAFTNGPTHAQVLAGLLGASSDNYAVGGARAVGSQTLTQYLEPRIGGQVPGLDIYQEDASQADLDFDINFGGQVQRFLTDAATMPAAPGTAAGFFIGLNDYSEFTPTSPETALAEATALVGEVVGNTIEAAAAATLAGVETILFYTMPNFRFFPASTLQTPETLALGDQLVAAHNGALAQGGAFLETLGAEVRFIDLARMSDEISTDPSSFGLRADLFASPALLTTGGNPTLVERPDGTWAAVFAPNPAVAGVDPGQLAFIDFVHPTASVHAIWGVFSAETLTSETVLRGAGHDAVLGTRRDDLVLAGAGDDRVATGRGADVVLAGLGDDRVAAGSGEDIVAGGAGCDVLFGGRGADVLADGAGRDRVFGGRGADLLVDGAGFDRLHGGAGNDAFLLVDPALTGGDPDAPAGRMFGGQGRDTLWLMLADETRAAVEADWIPGAARQSLAALGLETEGIERLVFLDPEEGPGAVVTPARLDEALLWGFV
jgi:Ca2+-binding RTX toxin-like protein